MLALKKKREAEAKAKAEAAAAQPMDVDKPDAPGGKEKVSLLGIGGKKKTKSGENGTTKKRTPGELRIQNDIAELDGGKVATIEFPNPNDLTKFRVFVTPDSGFWKKARYEFEFVIGGHYPHEAPKVTCHTKIYHPNINLEGKVCLNILREDWKPVLDINAVIYGLIYLFYEPNPDDPLNHEAAELFRKDVHQFERLVTRTLRGGMLDGVQFERLV
uniref:UBC core domain-containing protein n=1 Tax=Grammatophora oceanica TaxID=210454 RepID=A0A7S1V632_9STRA|mmetsp:Transcript_37668/g.56053  ORF Transcript_37668/g.56053 Transcript_37668/m.56053 type:complete len:216 (+) Transcript_37668:123-770(+)|eukprot:CAMPEP_0194048198 /NCGR_PEP_ID=MMETSP0009_2-20130614/26780_1 /TAXON_ID=210454 /ORGANISM="Grammatophora oceanica, Strain CCMP 410" /LENGTH=215 /DNA_ID=CAMNT_0038694015 /DNA_START=119 /DNA_END=766 /DNA_ORIENTATION=+